jgi:prevent-host-death family protein
MSYMSTISASAARQNLPAQLDLVEAGEEVAITRHGRVVAVLVHPDVLRTRRAADAWAEADRVDAMLQRAAAEALPEPVLTRQRAEELAEDVRAARAAR